MEGFYSLYRMKSLCCSFSRHLDAPRLGGAQLFITSNLERRPKHFSGALKSAFTSYHTKLANGKKDNYHANRESCCHIIKAQFKFVSWLQCNRFCGFLEYVHDV